MIVDALVWEPVARARLVEVLRAQASVRFHYSASGLVSVLERGAAGVVVVDKADRAGNSTLRVVRRLRGAFPAVPIVLYCALTPDASRVVLDFARAGINEIVFRGLDDLRAALRAALDVALDRCSVERTLSEIEPLVPAPVRSILRYCVENGCCDVGVRDLAAALSVTRKTLVNRLRAAGYPSPSVLISWGRLLRAAPLLDDPGRSAEQVAMLLGFRTGAALRNLMKRYTGLTTTEIREHGGLRCVLHAFMSEMSSPLVTFDHR